MKGKIMEGGSFLAKLTEHMNARTQAEDSVIGQLSAPMEGVDIRKIVQSASGNVAAVIRVHHTPVDSPLALWKASSVESAQLRAGSGARATDFSDVLDAWLSLPLPAPETENGDLARSLRLPITLSDAVTPLIERGFAPATATMFRPFPAETQHRGPEVAGLTLRQATEQDRTRMRDLMRELIRTESPYGAVRQRAPEVSDFYPDEALGFGYGWTLVAEAEGEIIGWASVTPPEQSEWAADSVSVAPIAYFGIAIVTREFRSRGVGRALVDALHHRARVAGVRGLVLDASALNPWSVPFWHRQGYRPIWVTWQRREPRF